MDDEPGRPLLITADASLAHAVSRVAAAAGVRPESTDEPAVVRRAWQRASGVMVGPDLVERVAGWGLERRAGLALVLARASTPVDWQRAVAAGADRVVSLPVDEAELVGWLAALRDGAHDAGLVVAVMPAQGGAGASTVAVCLASALGRTTRPTALVDADPGAGGLELVVGSEQVPGVRWADLATAAGRITGPALREALPHLDGVAVLSTAAGDETDVTPARVREVVVAAASSFDSVVVDLPRGTDAWLAELGPVADVLLVVAPTGLRSASAAARAVGKAGDWSTDVRLVVRRQPGSGIGVGAFAEAVGQPAAASVGTRRVTRRAVADGVGPVLVGRDRRRVAALADELRQAHGRRRR